MKRIHVLGMVGAGIVACAALTQPALARVPAVSCYGSGNMIMCAEKFSDASSTADIPVKVVGADGKTVLESKLNNRGEIRFSRPMGAFNITFGDGDNTLVQSPKIHELIRYSHK